MMVHVQIAILQKWCEVANYSQRPDVDENNLTRIINNHLECMKEGKEINGSSQNGL